jgi:mannan endo-1,4-beta-mannosidase
MRRPSFRFAPLLLGIYLPACGADAGGTPVPMFAAPEAPASENEQPPPPSPEQDPPPAGSVDQAPPDQIAGNEDEPVAPDTMDEGTEEPPVTPPPEAVAAERPEGNIGTGFFVEDGRLYDRLGNDFVIRGINHPVAWFRNQSEQWMQAIADTGANTVRIVWETADGQGRATPLDLLRTAIASAIDKDMIPMVELHDVTGDTTNAGVLAMAQYYARDDVRDILLEFEDYLLVNIANEWSGTDFANAYQAVITTLRDAGVNHTLVIDSNGFGQNANTIFQQGPGLLSFDPQHNLLFSVHMYEQFANRQNEANGQRISQALQTAVTSRIPFIVGEFGFQHGDDGTGNPRPIPFDVLMSEANRLGIGYIAWSWTGNGDGVEYLDLTNRQTGAFTDWGTDIVEGPSAGILGIRGTAVPASVFLPSGE